MSEPEAKCYVCHEAAGRQGLSRIGGRLFCLTPTCQHAGCQLDKMDQAAELVSKAAAAAVVTKAEPFDRRTSRPQPAPVAPARPAPAPLERLPAPKFDPRQSQRPAPAPPAIPMPPAPKLDPLASMRRAGR